MSPMASQITSLGIVYSTVYSGSDQRKHQSSASLAFVRRIHRGPVNSPQKWPVTRKMFSFDDVIMDTWIEQVQNTHSNPILRTYCNFKHNFDIEIYLDAIKHHKYRVAMSQLRTSSHTLAIEYGRYTRPKTKIEDRNCSICHVLEDERHFVMDCTINQPERENLFSKLARLVPNFTHMNDDEKFIFLMCNKDPQILTWVGKFIHKSFKDLAEHLS